MVPIRYTEGEQLEKIFTLKKSPSSPTEVWEAGRVFLEQQRGPEDACHIFFWIWDGPSAHFKAFTGGVVFWGNYQIYLNHHDPPPKWPQRTPHARQATAVSFPDLLFLCARLAVVAVNFLVP